MRAAIYFTPPARDRLTQAAGLWLGRSAFDGEAMRPPDESLDPFVAEPARYGFHATIRAPFRLAEGCDISDIDARLSHFAASRTPVRLAQTGVRPLGPFFALVPTAANLDLADLEAATLEAFEPYRAPLTPQEVARRRPETLTERQRDHLDRFGYPHVLEDFRFHMTLTGPVPPDKATAIGERLAAHFAAFEDQPLTIGGLALFVEPQDGAPFRVHSLHEFSTAEGA